MLKMREILMQHFQYQHFKFHTCHLIKLFSCVTSSDRAMTMRLKLIVLPSSSCDVTGSVHMFTIQDHQGVLQEADKTDSDLVQSAVCVCSLRG